jgi:CBS domain-containing protein
MKTELITISGDTTVEVAINLLIEKKVGTLPVVDNEGKLLGLVTMKELLARFLPAFFGEIEHIDFIENLGDMELPTHEHKKLLSEKVTDHMDRSPHYVSPECSILSAIIIMNRHNLSDLLVLEKKRLRGLVSTVDLGAGFLTWIKEALPLEEAEDSSDSSSL